MIGTLAGRPATHARIWISKWGLPWAEVTLDDEHSLTGQVDLTVADLTMRMTVVSGGPSHGRSYYRLVGGAGGWGREIPAKGYATDAGVKLSTVLSDAASAAGETFGSALPTTRIGEAFVRAAAAEGAPPATAATVLQQLVPNAWYVAADGLTYLGARAASTASGYTLTEGPDLARGTATLAAESIAGIVPGLVVEGIDVIDVMHELTPKRLRSHVWGATTEATETSRRLAAYRAIIGQLFPGLRFGGIFEYRVVTQSVERLNLQAVRVSMGMPDLRRVRVSPGIPGAKATHALGARVLVSFIDSDPSRPRVVGFPDAEDPGFVPTLLTFAEGDQGVAREADPIAAGYLISGPPGVVSYRESLTDAWVPLPSGTGAGGAPQAVDVGLALTGQITDGSTLVRCG